MRDNTVVAIITNDSLSRLGLKVGAMVIAEVKAPWITVYKSDKEPNSTAQNSFRVIVQRITRGKVTREVVVRVPEGLELCSIITEESRQRVDIRENDEVWVEFNAFSVVLHVD